MRSRDLETLRCQRSKRGLFPAVISLACWTQPQAVRLLTPTFSAAPSME